MEKIRHIEQAVLRSRRLPGVVIGLALVILAGVVALGALQARQRIRAQMAGRDSEVLYAVALWHYGEDVKESVAGPGMNAGDQLNVALKSSELRGVLGVRLFDPDGNFVESFPRDVIEANLPRAHLSALKALRPVSRFLPRAEMAGLFYPDETAPRGQIPLLEVFVPLHTESGPLAGIAQFLVEGHSLAADYARLDRSLATSAVLAFGAGGTILAATLAWAFRRLRRAQRLLTERTENLVRANQELALAAKASALGAVTAHLIHGLRNPLAGLQNFMVARGGSEADAESDWQQAVASTARMQAMINQVIGVLQEEQAGAGYEVTLAELEQMVRNRVQLLARNRGVNFTTVIQAEAALPNRVANLVALILVNLAENALQATPAGKTVTLAILVSRARCQGSGDGASGSYLTPDTSHLAPFLDGRVVFEVRDEGAGFPADTPLFMPCRSTKDGGSGIGLALCKQLANHLGAELELAASTAAGCVFGLKLPVASGGAKASVPTPRL